MEKLFKFKQFTVNQDRSAMKIGTDGVLLGAWTTVNHNPLSVLDIGAGTGILSLMLAQRSNAQLIEAVEIDDDAYEQCAENFENSPWNDRLFCYHASLLEYTEEIDDTYDLIICNPPFFPTLSTTSLPKGDKLISDARKTARFQDAMPFEHLIYAVRQFLSENGIFSVIIPKSEEKKLIDLALKVGLFPNRILYVKGNPEAKIKRSLIEFSFQEKFIQTEELIIENGRHKYTDTYIDLTKDFYIKM